MPPDTTFPDTSTSTPNVFYYDTNPTYVRALDSTFLNLTRQPEVQSGLISDEVIQYIYTIYLSIINGTFCLFGVIANTINIIIFYRQGMKETVNIALMGLSISDLCSVISLLWSTICYNPLFMYSDVPILTNEIQYKTGGWTHVIFTRVTAFLTVYITFERCLCITFPLKIKRILTPKRVMTIIVAIYVIIIGSNCPNYFSIELAWKFVPSRNRTMLGMVYKKNRHVIQTATYYINVLYLVTSLVGVVTCSAVLIWKLQQRSKWLSTTTCAQQGKPSTNRDRQVGKLILCIAIIFMCSFTPSVVLFLTLAMLPEVNFGKRYGNLFIILSNISFTLDAINSSVNIFVYFKMSSKYKGHFHALFCRNTENDMKKEPASQLVICSG